MKQYFYNLTLIYSGTFVACLVCQYWVAGSIQAALMLISAIVHDTIKE